MKKNYTAPELTVYGDAQVLTQGHNTRPDSNGNGRGLSCGNGNVDGPSSCGNGIPANDNNPGRGPKNH